MTNNRILVDKTNVGMYRYSQFRQEESVRGRKSKLTKSDIPRIRQWMDEGKTNGQIAKLIGVHRTNLQKFLSKHNLTKQEATLPDVKTEKHRKLCRIAHRAANKLSRYYSDKYPGFDKYELESRLIWESWFGYSKWNGVCNLHTFLNQRFNWAARKYADQLSRDHKHFLEYKQLAKMRQVFVY